MFDEQFLIAVRKNERLIAYMKPQFSCLPFHYRKMAFLYLSFLFAATLTFTSAYYECMCNYAVQTTVFREPAENGTAIGSMGEFDCKPSYLGTRSSFLWIAIQYEKQVSDQLNKPQHDKTNKLTCAPSEDSDQLGHPSSLISLRCPHEESLGP